MCGMRRAESDKSRSRLHRCPAIPRRGSPHDANRPTVGVAFGGGSARGIAHVGVIRWLDEHRIPIDMAAGTSMGGLVGGVYATGMDPAELETFVTSLNWDELFGASTFAYKNIRRKIDARAYPVATRIRAEGRRRAAGRSEQRTVCRVAARPPCRRRTSTSTTSTICRRRFERWPSIFFRHNRS